MTDRVFFEIGFAMLALGVVVMAVPWIGSQLALVALAVIAVTGIGVAATTRRNLAR